MPDVDDFDLRISVAEVTESGPFSTFPGYTRWSLLLDGGPISLGRVGLVNDNFLVLDGGQEVVAEVGATTHLLNILARTPIAVGIGDSKEPVDIAFALEDTADLKKWHLHLFEEPAVVIGPLVWIRRA